MTLHHRFQRLLVFPDELSPIQRDQLTRHLAGCVSCRQEAAMIQANRAALAAVTQASAPPAFRRAVLDRATKQPRRRRRILTRGRQMTIAAAACLAAAFWVISGLLQQPATPAGAYAILQRAAQLASTGYPYTGSARVTFAKTPWYLLPPRVSDYAGHYRILSRWWVKDPNHFRVDLRILSPSLERGRVIVVFNGRALTMYDARAGRTSVLNLSSVKRMWLTPSHLLALLQSGTLLSDYSVPPGIEPAPSVQDYLSRLLASRSSQGVHPYARIVRQGRMLGYPVDVVDFGPLAVSANDSSGCSPTVGTGTNATITYAPASACHHYRQELGWGRVFVGRDIPIIFRFEEHGIKSIENVISESVNYRYQVTALRQRASIPAGTLNYRSPVPPIGITIDFSKPAAPLFGTYQGEQPQNAPQFVDLPEPGNGSLTIPWYSRLATTYFALQPDNQGTLHVVSPPVPAVSGVDVLFALNPQWTQVFTSWHGQASIYITGRYVLAQERLLAKGLPTSFTSGAKVRAGVCLAWTGAYANGHRWLALTKKKVSIVISTNSLTTVQLTAYVAQDVCSR